MPVRLWTMLLLLCAAIAVGAGLALYVGVQEVRLHAAGPRRQVLAEDLPGQTGWVQVLGCARHDLEVAISPDGIVVAGERDAQDRIYVPLTPQGECEEDTPPSALHIRVLVESADGMQQGLSRLYDRGYRAPPNRVIVEGVIGYGAGDGRAEFLARKALGQRGLHLDRRHVPLLVKGKRPGSLGIAWATVAVGTHGILLILFLAGLALRRHLRGGLPPPPP